MSKIRLDHYVMYIQSQFPWSDQTFILRDHKKTNNFTFQDKFRESRPAWWDPKELTPESTVGDRLAAGWSPSPESETDDFGIAGIVSKSLVTKQNKLQLQPLHQHHNKMASAPMKCLQSVYQVRICVMTYQWHCCWMELNQLLFHFANKVRLTGLWRFFFHIFKEGLQ